LPTHTLVLPSALVSRPGEEKNADGNGGRAYQMGCFRLAPLGSSDWADETILYQDKFRPVTSHQMEWIEGLQADPSCHRYLELLEHFHLDYDSSILCCQVPSGQVPSNAE